MLNSHTPSRHSEPGSGAGVPGFESHSLPYQLWESGPTPDLTWTSVSLPGNGGDMYSHLTGLLWRGQTPEAS